MKRRGIIAMSFQVTAITFVIKILGLLKQSIIASVCGATYETDAYFIASGVIVALCTVFFSAVSVSFLSMYTERMVQSGRNSANNLINAVLRFFLPISAVIAVLFFAFSPIISRLFAPSYEGQQLATLTQYIRLMSVMFVFTCYTLVINVALEADKRFIPGKVQNLLQNAFIIIGALFFYKSIGINALLYAFVFAGIIQCIQITITARKVFWFRWRITSEANTIKKLNFLIIPLLLGNAIYEINDIVDKQIASGIGDGSVSYLTYGASINEMVSTLIISSVSTVLFSHYATWVAEERMEEINKNLRKTTNALFMLIVPIMIVCVVCGEDIVQLLYGRGNFGDAAVIKTASVVLGYAIGFFFQATRSILIRVYYAFQDTKTPMINGVIAVGINISLSLILSRYLGVGGISLATSIAMLTVTLLLLPKIRYYLPSFQIMDDIFEYLKIIVAGIITILPSYFLRHYLDLPYYMELLFVSSSTIGLFCLSSMVLRIKIFYTLTTIVRNRIHRD